MSGFFSFSPSGSKLTQHNVGVYSCDGTVLCRCHWGYIDIHESCTDGLTVLGNYLVRTRKQGGVLQENYIGLIRRWRIGDAEMRNGFMHCVPLVVVVFFWELLFVLLLLLLLFGAKMING